MQFKITVYHYTPLLQWLKFKRLAIPNVDDYLEELEFPYTPGRNVKLFNYFWKQF